MIKQIQLFAIVFVLLVQIPVFAQDYTTCPKGSYHGLDNAGNDACRDIKTNQIVQGKITQKTQNNNLPKSDPCTNPLAPGCISLPFQNFEEIMIVFGIVGILLVLILAVAKIKPKKHHEKIATDDSTYYPPNNWSEDEKDSGDRIMWTCSICKQKFADRSSYMSHGCHFR